MFRRSVFTPILVLILGSVPAPAQPASEKKPLAIEDLQRFDGPRALVLAPDGQQAAYVRTWIAGKTEHHSLWLVEGQREQRRALENGEPDARNPVFSPDGRWIAFLSTRAHPKGWKTTPPAPPQSEAAVDIWLLPTSGGQAIPLAGPDRSHGRVFHDGFYGRLAFSPDGRQLAFIADDGSDSRTPTEIANDVLIVRPDQGEGYTGYGAAQLWVAHLQEKPGKWAASKIERLTKDSVWYGDPQWAPDGRTIVVHANKTQDRESVRYSINKNFDLWAINVATRQQQQLTTGPGPEVSPRFSPDGKTIACLSIPRKGSHRDVFNLALVTLGKGEPRTRVLFDHHTRGLENPPHRPPAFPLPEECWEDNQYLVYSSEKGTSSQLTRVDCNTGKGVPVAPAAAKETPPRPTTFAQRAHKRQQLTPPGNLFLKERLLGEQKVITWKNEGLTIEGILTLPPAGVAKAPYKLVLHPHGGPHSRAAQGFDFTVQVLAGHGYAVLQPNFRGSSGYDQKFIDADRFDLGGGDMRDCLTGIEELVRQGLVDRERQFVFGTSYGGFMTCWLVGQTHQFRAAVAVNAVTDLNMMWGLSDLQSWTQWEFGGYPWEVPDRMRQHSPLTHAAKVKTPTLILHSRDDRRCPLPMGQSFHQALLARHVPTQMVIYPNEGHGIRQPRHRQDLLERVLAWFEQHGGK